MHSLGISVYPDKSDIKEVYEYMETAAKLGFSRIFTCFLSIPDDKRESYLKEFKGFMDKAHELGFVVAVRIARSTASGDVLYRRATVG